MTNEEAIKRLADIRDRGNLSTRLARIAQAGHARPYEPGYMNKCEMATAAASLQADVDEIWQILRDLKPVQDNAKS
jgi:hypothetical protein